MNYLLRASTEYSVEGKKASPKGDFFAALTRVLLRESRWKAFKRHEGSSLIRFLMSGNPVSSISCLNFTGK